MLTGSQILEEYKKCYIDKSRIYMIEHYFTTMDGTQNKIVPFKLFPKQKELVRALSENTDVITTKPRQAGISTTVSAFFACEIALAAKSQPETILIVANRLDLSKLDLKKIKEFLLQIPRWFWGEEFFGSEELEKKTIFIKDNDKYFELFNGCKVHACSSAPNSSRGVSAVTRLIIDEAAFLDNGMATYSAAVSTQASSKKSLVLISTPNGYDEVYHKIFDGAKKKNNGFKLVEMRWYQDPRYNKNLTWSKYDKETHEIYNITEPTIDSNGNIEFDEKRWEELIQDGYKPSSPWYVLMCNSFNHDKQKIAQELDVSFVGSAGNVIDPEITEEHKTRNTREPIYVDNFFPDAWIFKEPILGHRYIMPIDASTGAADDSSVIHILDIDYIDENGKPSVEQVFEYQGKLQGDILGELANKYGTYYGNALAIVDCIGSSGDAAILKLQTLEYPNLYYDDPALKNVTVGEEKANKLSNQSDIDKMPGFRASSVRMPMLMNLEKMLRFFEITPRSKRFIQELTTFIWKNGRPDHQSGHHDDTVTSMAMGLFVVQFSFKRLEAVKEKNKAILNSMVLVQKTINNGGMIVPNETMERIKKIPVQFYLGAGKRPSPATEQQTPKTREEIIKDKNKILNKFLNEQLNHYLR